MHQHNLKWSNIERVIYCSDPGCSFSLDATEILEIVDSQHKFQVMLGQHDTVKDAMLEWFANPPK